MVRYLGRSVLHNRGWEILGTSVAYLRRSHISTFFLVLLIGNLPVLAQTGGETSVEVYDDAGPLGRMSLEPPSAALLFPNSRLYLSDHKVTISLPTGDDALLQKMKFVTVRAYSLQGDTKTGSSRKQETMQASSARIEAVISNGKIYILGQLFCDESVSVFNELSRSINLTANSPEDALLVAEFYLQLGYYRFASPNNFIVSTAGELSAQQTEFPGQNMDEIEHALHPPAVVKEDATYRIEIVAKDEDSGFVLLRHWSIGILGSHVSDAKEGIPRPEAHALQGWRGP